MPDGMEKVWPLLSTLDIRSAKRRLSSASSLPSKSAAIEDKHKIRRPARFSLGVYRIFWAGFWDHRDLRY